MNTFDLRQCVRVRYWIPGIAACGLRSVAFPPPSVPHELPVASPPKAPGSEHGRDVGACEVWMSDYTGMLGILVGGLCALGLTMLLAVLVDNAFGVTIVGVLLVYLFTFCGHQLEWHYRSRPRR